MNELDVYYRALLEYKKQTAESNKCTALRDSIASASVDGDRITVKTASCTIDEDWVEAIETGLVHIEKAIKMERQFIRSNGEVVPIEKVKHVSRESVEHLAKHSNLISRYDEGEDIVPDQLYTVERLQDYAVYENRFLYMLLCYLRDFVALRYNDILDLTNKYDADVVFDKKVSNGKQSISYTLSMHDVRRDDDYLKEHNPSKDIIDRVDLILKTVLAFLATPLMEEVGKAPMLKPPITKTNVLKMNNSFKGAVALYDFIIAYDKKGYEIKTHERTIAPFRDELAQEMAEAGGIISFLTYEWGLGIKQELKESYQREEERRNAEQIKQRADRIASMQRKLKNSNIGIEEYVITIEKQLRALTGESERAEKLAKEVDTLLEVERKLNRNIDLLKEENKELNQAMLDERQRHYEELEELRRAHEDAMHELVLKHEAEIADINEKHVQHVSKIMEDHEEQVRQLRDIIKVNEQEHNARISGLREDHARNVEELSSAISNVKKQLSSLRSEHEDLIEAKRLSDARIKALCGTDRDLTDRDSFNELEKEYHAFTALYREQWAKTKRQIRKNHLNLKNIKGQKDRKDD